jgi:hypothetical protein
MVVLFLWLSASKQDLEAGASIENNYIVRNR